MVLRQSHPSSSSPEDRICNRTKKFSLIEKVRFCLVHRTLSLNLARPPSKKEAPNQIHPKPHARRYADQDYHDPTRGSAAAPNYSIFKNNYVREDRRNKESEATLLVEEDEGGNGAEHERKRRGEALAVVGVDDVGGLLRVIGAGGLGGGFGRRGDGGCARGDA